MASFCPPVRELAPGERPSDWVSAGASDSADDVEAAKDERPADERPADERPADEHPADANDVAVQDSTGLTTAPARVFPIPHDMPPITGPQLYQVQFTTSEERVELVERANALLSSKPSLGELHLQAMRLLVEALEKKRYGAKRSRQRGVEPEAERQCQRGSEAVEEHPRWRGVEPRAEHPRQRGAESVTKHLPEAPKKPRSRYIPAANRRAVLERDEGRCTYVDESGQRCQEAERLHIHHVEAFAKGGTHALSDLTLRCQAHNDLAAEEDFGRAHMAAKREGGRHESLRRALGEACGMVDE